LSNEGSPGEKKKRKFSSLILGAVAVLAVMGISISLYTFFMSKENTPAPETAATVDGPYLIYGPQDFTVNLSDGAQRRYLKVTMALGYEEKKLAKELEQRSVQIRDLIIEVLRNRSADDVENGKGTTALRTDLIAKINEILSKGTIKEIYFTDFLVQ
jgi:flagellar basal body-associated protein FliL